MRQPGRPASTLRTPEPAGRSIEAGAVIVVRADQTSLRRGDERGDPIYGKALTETWQWLREKSERDVIDLGYGALERLLPSNPAELNELRQRLSPPAPNAPVMLPAHVMPGCRPLPLPLPTRTCPFSCTARTAARRRCRYVGGPICPRRTCPMRNYRPA